MSTISLRDFSSCEKSRSDGRWALSGELGGELCALRNDLGNVDSEGGCEIMLMLLLLHEDLADLLGECEVAEGFGLLDALTIGGNGLGLVIEIEAKHLLWLVGELDFLRRGRGHTAEIVHLIRDDEGVLQLFQSVLLQFCGDGHVFCALEDVGVHRVCDHGLIFACEVFVERVDEFLERLVVLFVCHHFSSMLLFGWMSPSAEVSRPDLVYVCIQRSGCRMGKFRTISGSSGSGSRDFQRSRYSGLEQARPQKSRPGERTGQESKCCTSFA